MPNYNLSTRQSIADINAGLRVDRAAGAIAAATTPYFTVTTGNILLLGLIAEVTVASGANLCSWSTNGTAGTTTSLCADLDINPALVGDILGITGVVATAMTYGSGAVWMIQPMVIVPGTIDFIGAAADGSISSSLFYVPLEDGSYVVTA